MTTLKELFANHKAKEESDKQLVNNWFKERCDDICNKNVKTVFENLVADLQKGNMMEFNKLSDYPVEYHNHVEKFPIDYNLMKKVLEKSQFVYTIPSGKLEGGIITINDNNNTHDKRYGSGFYIGLSFDPSNK